MVSAGMDHTVLLRSDGVAVACGMNCFGQCDIPSLPKRMTYNYPGFVRRNANSTTLRSDGKAVAQVEVVLMDYAEFHA